MRIYQASVQPYELPYRVALIAGGKPLETRTGWLLSLEDEDGHWGYGDAACWAGFGSGDATLVRAALEAISHSAGPLHGVDFRKPDDIADWCNATRFPVEARSALECALLDIMGKRLKRSIARLLSPTPRETVPVQELITDASDVSPGVQVVKLKVGRDLDQDVERIAQVRSKLDEHGKIRLDANGAWSLDAARHAIERFAPHGIEWIEQPVSSLEDLARLRPASPIRIAADEAVSDRPSLERALALAAADVYVFKPLFLGGVFATRDLAARLANHEVKFIVGHGMASSVERHACLQTAAALEPSGGACGLSSPFATDLTANFEVADGFAKLPRAPGLGLTETPGAQP